MESRNGPGRGSHHPSEVTNEETNNYPSKNSYEDQSIPNERNENGTQEIESAGTIENSRSDFQVESVFSNDLERISRIKSKKMGSKSSTTLWKSNTNGIDLRRVRNWRAFQEKFNAGNSAAVSSSVRNYPNSNGPTTHDRSKNDTSDEKIAQSTPGNMPNHRFRTSQVPPDDSPQK